MAKLLATLSLLLAIVTIGVSASKLPQNDKVNFLPTVQNFQMRVVTPDEAKEILKQYPNATKLEPIAKRQNRVENYDFWEFEYGFGQRVPGDARIASSVQNYNWGYVDNMDLLLEYPTSGVGDIITYMNILIRQSSPFHAITILSGGVGQRHATILIEAWLTTFLNHGAWYYGY